jgi:hypothetical protein
MGSERQQLDNCVCQHHGLRTPSDLDAPYRCDASSRPPRHLPLDQDLRYYPLQHADTSGEIEASPPNKPAGPQSLTAIATKVHLASPPPSPVSGAQPSRRLVSHSPTTTICPSCTPTPLRSANPLSARRLSRPRRPSQRSGGSWVRLWARTWSCSPNEGEKRSRLISKVQR